MKTETFENSSFNENTEPESFENATTTETNLESREKAKEIS